MSCHIHLLRCLCCMCLALPVMYVPCLCLAWTDRPNMCVRPSVSQTGPDRTGMLYMCVAIHPSVSSDRTGPDCHLQPSFASSCSAWPVPLSSPVTSAPRRMPPPLKPYCELKYPGDALRKRAMRAIRLSHRPRDLLLINDEIAPTGASSNEPQGADQPTEEVKAGFSVRVAGGRRVTVHHACANLECGMTLCRPRVGSTRSGCLSDGLWSIAQLEQLAAHIEASSDSEEEPAASVPLASRKRAHSKSDVGSKGSQKRARSVSDVGSKGPGSQKRARF